MHLKRMYPVVGQSVPNMSVRSDWFIVAFKSFFSVLIFCLAVLHIILNRALKSSTIICLLSLILSLSIS